MSNDILYKHTYFIARPRDKKDQPLKKNIPNHVVVGARVSVTDVRGNRVRGTAAVVDCGATYDMYGGCSIVILDSASKGLDRNYNSGFFQAAPWVKWTPDRARVINWKEIFPLPDQHSPEAWWRTLPKDLAVHFRAPVTYENVAFSEGAVGRPVYQDGDRTLVSWLNWKSNRFYPNDEIGAANCYQVDTNLLDLCLVDQTTIVASFGPLQSTGLKPPKFKEGELLVYASPKGMGPRKPREGEIPEGTILSVMRDNGGPALDAKWLGGCLPEHEGAVCAVDKRHVTRFPFTFLPRGAKISVEQDLKFHKRSLQGLKGNVKLCTDMDGDVGVEFAEDIGAGSLDGEGKDGHCLYLPAQSLKISE